VQVKDAVNKKGPMPPWWSMAYYCLDLNNGTIRHFPAGTYDKQIKTREGRNELSLMETVYQAWRTFKTPASKWTDTDRRIAGSIMPQAPEPTRRLDWLIARLWHGSAWSHIVTRQLRGISNG